MDNLIQYATAVVAYGAKLAYDTETGSLDVAEYPKGKDAKKILDAALADIVLFEDTSNFLDGKCILALADIVDNSPNPLQEISRLNILIEAGIMREGKFIRQILERIKANRSWHISEVPNTCSHFGEICTNRGISDTTHKPGRKSDRLPEQYHIQSTRGIGREQLVTPAIELLYDSIPDDRLISETKIRTISLPNLENLSHDELQALIEKIRGAMNDQTVPKS